ncbi:phage tail protein [Plebeiibacterium marinum]|uniref:Tail fiber protein n=1 Tax=Plebeiibacterium marinum TaxID=2992111 RepID=A0AAE3MH92_9BACT|nr:tail fiber protein [Plebeiobacterium marinum]MCW3807561.1 tail fiber protein [Plebeiobacterium marinum]
MKRIQLLISLFIFTTGIIAQEPILGEIRMFAGNFAPRGWAFCDGQLLPISENTALYSLLGTTYGGDGRTTFALPDLRGRAPIHAGQGIGLSPRHLGQSSGTETNILSINQLPAHTHPISVSNKAYDDEANSDDPTGKYPAVSGENMYSNQYNVDAAAPEISIGNTGNSHAINNMQPYITIHFIIALQGIYPSRN